MLKGTIIKGIGGFYYVDTENGVYECRARGIFRKEGIKPTVGDNVEISVLDENDKEGSLDVIQQRKTLLTRPRVANVDQTVIVFAAKSNAHTVHSKIVKIVSRKIQHISATVK